MKGHKNNDQGLDDILYEMVRVDKPFRSNKGGKKKYPDCKEIQGQEKADAPNVGNEKTKRPSMISRSLPPGLIMPKYQSEVIQKKCISIYLASKVPTMNQAP